MRKNLMTGLIYTVLTILSVTAIWGLLKETATGNSCYFTTNTDDEESAYLEELKDTLAKEGLFNCGITMTKSTEDGVVMMYEVAIHAPAINNMNESELQHLNQAMDTLTPMVENCLVQYKISD